MRLIIVLIIAFFANNCLVAQTHEKIFQIDGTVNTDSGKVFLMPINPLYYPKNRKPYEISSVVIKGKFSFIEKISYPHSYQIGIKINNELVYLSNYFGTIYLLMQMSIILSIARDLNPSLLIRC